MPFSCKFQLNNGELQPTDEVIFEHFIESSFGEFHQEKVKIAKVIFNGQQAAIYSNCPCFPSSINTKLQKGQLINSNTEIGYFSANGEDIPYDKPYAKIQLINSANGQV
ncbi:hypothetical protein [Echinicola sp. 20G]|uniref:hypothetical protein n=1 Tax=Echinicola sp. 20G TaxID=2781961 RepID=UPI001910282B|nr:hypothetical protein [Echinicola sp. 20G]